MGAQIYVCDDCNVIQDNVCNKTRFARLLIFRVFLCTKKSPNNSWACDFNTESEFIMGFKISTIDISVDLSKSAKAFL